jgi:hypothetical protein
MRRLFPSRPPVFTLQQFWEAASTHLEAIPGDVPPCVTFNDFINFYLSFPNCKTEMLIIPTTLGHVSVNVPKVSESCWFTVSAQFMCTVIVIPAPSSMLFLGSFSNPVLFYPVL